jgi:hypothetical protein
VKQAAIGFVPIVLKPTEDERGLQQPFVQQQSKQCYIDVNESCKNFQAKIDAYNEGKILGDKIKHQHKILLQRLIVMLTNKQSLAMQQEKGVFFYVINTDAKAIATLFNYVGSEPEKTIKAHINRLMNLTDCFLVFQIGSNKNNYRYLIGLKRDLISWKKSKPT